MSYRGTNAHSREERKNDGRRWRGFDEVRTRHTAVWRKCGGIRAFCWLLPCWLCEFARFFFFVVDLGTAHRLPHPLTQHTPAQAPRELRRQYHVTSSGHTACPLQVRRALSWEMTYCSSEAGLVRPRRCTGKDYRTQQWFYYTAVVVVVIVEQNEQSGLRNYMCMYTTQVLLLLSPIYHRKPVPYNRIPSS